MASRSPPAEKCPPAPRSTSTRQDGSFRRRPNASSSSSIMAWVSALRRSGRFERQPRDRTVACERDVGVVGHSGFLPLSSRAPRAIVTGSRNKNRSSHSPARVDHTLTEVSWAQGGSDPSVATLSHEVRKCRRASCARVIERPYRRSPLLCGAAWSAAAADWSTRFDTVPRPRPIDRLLQRGLHAGGAAAAARRAWLRGDPHQPQPLLGPAGDDRLHPDTGRPKCAPRDRRISTSAISDSRAAGRPRAAMPATRSGSMPTSGSNASPAPRRAPLDRENPRLRSLVKADDSGIDDAVSPRQHVSLLRTAAEMPNVDRIFVNKFIKERLCQTATGNRAWLNKLVVWAGHDEHFHVRLHCPPGNPQCQPQAGYYSDDGCGEPLDTLVHRAAGHAAAARRGAETLPAEAASRLQCGSERALMFARENHSACTRRSRPCAGDLRRAVLRPGVRLRRHAALARPAGAHDPARRASRPAC